MDRDSEVEADVQVLRETRIFNGLDGSALRALVDGAPRRCYDKHTQITSASGDEESVFLITSGTVRLYRLSDDGHEITLATLEPGDIMGLVYLESLTNPMSCAEAMADHTVIHCVPRALFLRFIEAYPNVVHRALDLLERRLGDAYDLIEDLALHDTQTRVARALARLAADDEQHAVSTTHDELARMVGTTRESVTKVLGNFRSRRLVEYVPHRRGIVVLDVEGLLDESSARG